MKLSYNFHLKGDMDLVELIMFVASMVTIIGFFI